MGKDKKEITEVTLTPEADALALAPATPPTPKPTDKSSADELDERIEDSSKGIGPLEKTNADKEEAEKKTAKKTTSGMVDLLYEANANALAEAQEGRGAAYAKSAIAQGAVRAAELAIAPLQVLNEKREKISSDLGKLRKDVIGAGQKKVIEEMGKGMDSLGELSKGANAACSNLYKKCIDGIRSKKQPAVDNAEEDNKYTPPI